MISIGKRIQGVIVLLFFCFIAIGQQKARTKSVNRAFAKGINYAELQDYQKAIDEFKGILKEEPNYSEAYLQLGLCYLNTNTKIDSALYFLKNGFDILPDEEQYSPLGQDFHMFIGKTYQIKQEPDSALQIYQKLLASPVNIDDAFALEINKEVQMCENAKVFFANPIKLTIVNLGAEVNSIYDDHSPLIDVYEDMLLFTSRRSAGKLPQLPDGQYPEKMYVANFDGENWKDAEALKVFFRNIEHESGLSLSADANSLFIYRHDNEGKNIYMSNYENGEWQEPKKLPFPINSEANETHASLSGDGSTIFFTSDRPGGIGGIDIYMCKKNAQGKWGKVRNLGPNVNTVFDEETSMIHPDGVTLYFASEGHSSMGGLDVFYTQMNTDSSWVAPVNLGYPINTPDDDFFFVPTLNKSEAYYASARFEDNYGGSDIYRVEFDKSFEGELAVVEGMVENVDALKTGAMRIMVTRKSDRKLVGDYRPNIESGSYRMFLQTGHEYAIQETVEEDIVGESVVNVIPEMAYQVNGKMYYFKDVKMDPPLQQLLLNNGLEMRNEEAIVTLEKKIVHIERPAYYTIQLLALKHSRMFAPFYLKGLDLKDIKIMKCKDGYTRYIYGVYTSREAALKQRDLIKKSGKYHDSFIRVLFDVYELEVD